MDLPTSSGDGLVGLLTEMKTESDKVTEHVDKLLEAVKEGQFNSEKGLSFLDLKNHLMLSYVINLGHLVAKKLSPGHSIKGDSAIDRLVEERTVLERMRPIEKKLQYQIEKYVKTATSETAAANNPLAHKPHPESFLPDGNEDENSDEEDSRPKKYVPPKLMATFYDGEDEKEKRELERAQRRALNSSLVRELAQQHSEFPEEVEDFAEVRDQSEREEYRHRQEFEEDNMMRLPPEKKRKTPKRSGLNSILQFGDYGAAEQPAAKKAKGKKKFQGKGAKSQKHKKRKF